MRTYEEELYHYGRLGMKWYQHIFGDVDARAKYSEAKRRAKEDKKLARDPYAIKSLSEEEIISRINKIRLEETYRELIMGKPREIKTGDTFAKSVFKSASKKYIENYFAEKGKQKAQRKQEKKRKEDEYYQKKNFEYLTEKDKERKELDNSYKEAGRQARKELVSEINDYIKMRKTKIEADNFRG